MFFRNLQNLYIPPCWFRHILYRCKWRKNSSCVCSSEFNSTCSSNGVKPGSVSCTETGGVVKYKSNDCNVPVENTASCPYEYRHYWNSDGGHTIPTADTYVNTYGNNITRAGGPCAFEGYGQTSTITIPAGKSYNTAVLRFWGTNNVINGEFKTNDWMRFEGWAGKTSKFNWTFNDKATIDGRIVVDETKIGTVNFKKGLYGNHYCEYATDKGNWNWVVSKTGQCPAEWYANTSDPDPCPYDYRHYWNSNGTYTIPTSDSYKTHMVTMSQKLADHVHLKAMVILQQSTFQQENHMSMLS